MVGDGRAFHFLGSVQADKAELGARAAAAFELAMDLLRGAPGASALPHKATQDMLRALVPAWANGAAASANSFRQRFFGEDADPVKAWGMQRAALAIRTAGTYARLKDAAADLAAGMRAVGLPDLPGFLAAAQKQASASPAANASPIQLVTEQEEEEKDGKEAQEEKKRLLREALPLGNRDGPTTEASPAQDPLRPPIAGGAALPQVGKQAPAAGDEQSPMSPRLQGDHNDVIPSGGNLKRVSEADLLAAARAAGYERTEQWKQKELGLNARSDIVRDRDGNLYSIPRKGVGDPQSLNMKLTK